MGLWLVQRLLQYLCTLASWWRPFSVKAVVLPCIFLALSLGPFHTLEGAASLFLYNNRIRRLNWQASEWPLRASSCSVGWVGFVHLRTSHRIVTLARSIWICLLFAFIVRALFLVFCTFVISSTNQSFQNSVQLANVLSATLGMTRATPLLILSDPPRLHFI